MKNYSVNELAKESGLDRRTIARRLEHVDPESDGKYSLASVLRAFEAHGAGNAAKLDLSQERALLAQEQRRKLERENNEAEGRHRPQIAVEELREQGKEIAGTFLLSIMKAAQSAAGVLQGAEPQVINDYLDGEYANALITLIASFGKDLHPEILAGIIEGLAHRRNCSDWRALLERRAEVVAKMLEERVQA